jgi:hypothetical protein
VKFSEFTLRVEIAISDHPDWRVGQAIFTVLDEVRPDLALTILGTDLDPFSVFGGWHAPDIVRTVDWLTEHWHSTP